MRPGQRFALVTGIFFFIIGIMGFSPAFVQASAYTPEAANLGFASQYGNLLGLFPVNLLHNCVHLILGLAGILSSIALDSSRVYSRIICGIYGFLAIIGFFPALNTTFGLMPVFGNNIWLHGITAAIAFYFGFIATPRLLDISDQPQGFSGTASQS